MPDVEQPTSAETAQIHLSDVLDALQPRIHDQSTLTPIRYWGLLAEAQTLLQRLGEQQQNAVITNAATLLADELQLMQSFEQRRRSLAR